MFKIEKIGMNDRIHQWISWRGKLDILSNFNRLYYLSYITTGSLNHILKSLLDVGQKDLFSKIHI